MKTRVRKWGNSLALRIPKSFAEEARLKENVAVDLAMVEGKLVVALIPKRAATLAELLAGVRKKNIHREVDFGAPRGSEVW